MIQMIRFEMKKYVFRKHNIYILLLFTIIFCFANFFGERQCFEEKHEIHSYYNIIGDTFTDKTKKTLEEEQSLIESKIYRKDDNGNLIPNQEEIRKKGKYSVTQMGDLGLISRALGCIEVVEKRNRNMAIIMDNSNSYQSGLLSMAYTAEKNNMLIDRLRLQAFSSNMYFGWPICILLVIIFSASFCTEREKNILGVLSITKRGEWSLYISKLITGIIVTIIVNLYFLTVFLLNQKVLIGLSISDLNQPLFLVNGYEMSASGDTLLTLLLTQGLLVIILSLVVTFAVMVLSKCIRKNVYVMISTLILFFVGTGVDIINLGIYKNDYIQNTENWYLVSVTTFHKLLEYVKLLNPFSVINVQYYLEQPRYLSLGSLQYPLYYSPIVIMIVVIGVSSIYLLQNKKG